MTRIVQITADCFICGHPIFLRHLRSIFNFKQSLKFYHLLPLQMAPDGGTEDWQ